MSSAAARGCDGRTLASLLVFALGLLVPCGSAMAQLSPGPLAEPHAELEGSANCLRCHSSERGVDPERCLSCHRLLAARIDAGQGLHARADHADCKSCHIDHHGREFELIWWGEEGMEAFDHSLTGHALEGAHRYLGCRECHREELNPRSTVLRSEGKEPDRSFLGLGTECLACHRDEHRGQFEAGSCTRCHDQSGWLPVSRFTHERTAFPLTGLHRQVGCEECHPTVADPTDGDASYVGFVGLEFSECSGCHRDPHAARFGADCEDCHETSGWRRIDERSFDHDLTRYPLLGRHRSVSCESCHRAGRPRRALAFEHCTDCHVDEHRGQLARRSDGGRCESCHTVEGFRPSTFGVEEHGAVFALEGAHRSVPCGECHRDVPLAELSPKGLVAEEGGGAGADALGPSASGPSSPGSSEGGAMIMQLRFASTLCVTCHLDPHRGSVGTAGGERGCELCHQTTSWTEGAGTDDRSFDHESTGFVLIGAHSQLECGSCHRTSGASETPEAIVFSGLGTRCASCHRDPHRGQLAVGTVTECGRCHQADRWIPAAGFDHARDAAFGLAGAHARVACERCHRRERDDQGDFVRFRPVPSRCSDCHGGSP